MQKLKMTIAVAATVVINIGFGAGTVRVAPDAAPGGDGSWFSPYSSLDAALEHIRAARAKGDNGSWTVKLAAGDYFIGKPVTLVPADSGTPEAPLRIVGDGMGETRVMGALKLQGFTAGPDGRWTVPAPRAADGGPIWFETLFVNGRRAVRARHPDTGFFNPEKVMQTVGTNSARRVYADEELTARPGDSEAVAYTPDWYWRYGQIVVHHNWDTTRRILLGYDRSRRVFLTRGERWKRWNPWRTNSLYYVENVPAALNAPGEWLYDVPAGRIVYIPRPGETPENAEVLYPVSGLKNLLVVAGDPKGGDTVHDIEIEGISFLYCDSPRRKAMLAQACLPVEAVGDPDKPGPTQIPPHQAAAWSDSAVLMDGACRISLRNCEVAHTGEYGVWLRGACSDNSLEHCLVRDLGAGGIRIGTAARGVGKKGERVTDLRKGETGRNRIDDCIIAGGGRRHAPGVGVWIGGSPYNSVTHCEISDFFYTGVSIGWTWGYGGSRGQFNTLAFCRIRNIGQKVLGDMGGVYTLGTSFGTCVSNNVIHDVDSFTYGGWGLYPDEGSEGIVMENNLVYDTKDASFHQHYGRDNVLRNNILAYSREGQVAVSRAEPHRSVTVERNILLWDEGETFRRYNGTKTEKAKINWIGNIWWKTKEPVEFNGKSFAEWQAKGNDKGGIVADPLFADSARRDFRLKPDSPAVKAGFKPFDISSAGVRGCAEWKALADRLGSVENNK